MVSGNGAQGSSRHSVALDSFDPVERRSMVSDTAGVIKQMIIDGQLRPGDRLPPERSLCEALQVSRATLREAIGSLVAMKILTAQQGTGTFVSSLRTEELLEPMQFVLALSHSNVDQLFEVRCVIEPELAALAAVRAQPEDLRELEDCIDRTLKWQDDLNLLLSLDERLHRLVAQAAHNGIFLNMLRSLESLAHASRRMTVNIPGLAKSSVKDHVGIGTAIMNGDAQKARVAMRAHLRSIRRRSDPSISTAKLSSGPSHGESAVGR